MRSLHVWAGVPILALVIGLGGWVVLTPNWAIAVVEAQALRNLGRALTVDGGAHLEIVPELALRLDQVSLAGPPGADDPFISAAALRLPLRFSNLFTHQLELRHITLVDPEINLSVDEMGRGSWPDQAGAEPAAADFFLENATVRVADKRNGQSFAFDKAGLAASISEAGELTIGGTAVINDGLARLQAYVKNVARVSAGGSPAELTLTAPALSVDFSGRLVTAGAIGLAGTITVSGPDLRAGLAWTGSAPGGQRGLKAFSLSGGLDATGRAFAVHGAEVSLDGIAGKGDLSLDFRGTVPKLVARLDTAAIRLDTYLPETIWQGGDWGIAPLGLAGLRGLDATVKLSLPDLVAGRLHTGPASIDATLIGGRLDASFASASLPAAKLTLDGSGEVQGFALALHSLDPTGLIGPLANIAWLTCAGTLDLSVQATGASQQEMVSTLKGEARLDLATGAIHGIDVGKALAAVSREMQDGWPGGGSGETAFTSLAAQFSIADGIASTKDMKLDNPSLTMSGTGDIDLLRQALDLRADPRLITGKRGETAGLPVAVVVKGPWLAPRLYPDMADIVANPKAAYEALKGLGVTQSPGATGGN